MDDQAYLEGLKNREPKILQAIYSNFFPAVLKLVESGKGNRLDAEDIFQDALVVLYRKLGKTDFELTSSFFTYFYAICRFCWYERIRKNKKTAIPLTENEENAGEDPQVEQELIQTEQNQLYRRKFKELGADCQKLLQLFFKGEKMAFIAEEMGYSSEGYAKKRKYKCKEKLVTLIKADHLYKELI